MFESKARINALIAKANTKTGGKASNLTTAMQTLIDGYGGGGGDDLTALIEGTITEVNSNASQIMQYAFYKRTMLITAKFMNATSIGNNAFNSCSNLTTVDCPKVISADTNTFKLCSSLISANFPSLKEVPNSMFNDCTALNNIYLPKATKAGSYSFQNCAFTKADFPVLQSITMGTFKGCSKLITLILRSSTVCSLGTQGISNTPIESGAGYVYVPRSLVETYKTATNWYTYADQIRAIEDYPEICGNS